MIIVDTSVWTDHFRSTDTSLSELLARRMVLMHPLVIGELALGNLRERASTLRALSALGRPVIATFDDVLELVERETLMGSGLSWIDAALLASASATSGTRLWTRDARLAKHASRLGLAMNET